MLILFHAGRPGSVSGGNDDRKLRTHIRQIQAPGFTVVLTKAG
jgi:hypothetical protein